MDSRAGLHTALTAAAGRASEQEVDLPTLVRKLRDDATTIRQSLAVLPPVNPYNKSQPRQKNWTSRSRMGCLTCRSRRIKCDETRPCCKRCTLTSRQCIYDKALYSVAPANPLAPVRGLPSPDWHIREALQYYMRVISLMHDWHEQGDNAYEFNYKASAITRSKYFDGEIFTMYVLSHRLQCLYNARQIAPRYGAVPGLNLIWARLFNQMAVVIQKLNTCIAASGDLTPAFRSIRMLMYVELCFDVSSWRAHAEGFGALMKSCSGGIHDLFSSDLLLVQYPLLVASICNTTSPPHDQIKQMSNWPDKDIAAAYSHTGAHAFPCPTAVFQAMIRITHLRTLVAANERAPEWEELAHAAFVKIQSVNPHDWGEPYSTDDNVSPLLARIYQAAVSLYAILTLPTWLAAVFKFPYEDKEMAIPTAGDDSMVKADTETPLASTTERGLKVDAMQIERDKLDMIHAAIENDESQLARVRYRSHLFRLLRRGMLALDDDAGVIWPAAVLGVAFQGHEREQVVLLRYIGNLRGLPASENGAASLFDKLVLFWNSGKKHWDQCFYEPTSVFT